MIVCACLPSQFLIINADYQLFSYMMFCPNLVEHYLSKFAGFILMKTFLYAILKEYKLR